MPIDKEPKFELFMASSRDRHNHRQESKNMTTARKYIDMRPITEREIRDLKIAIATQSEIRRALGPNPDEALRSMNALADSEATLDEVRRISHEYEQLLRQPNFGPVSEVDLSTLRAAEARTAAPLARAPSCPTCGGKL